MPEIMLLGIEEQVLSLEPDESPANNFPCMSCEGVHAELRTQLYAQLMGIFYDEAESLELLSLEFSGNGPWVYKLDYTMIDRLSEIEEDDIETITKYWSDSSEMSALGLEASDLQEVLQSFIYNLVHFCMMSRQEPVLSVFFYSE